MKKEILRMLREAGDDYISGQILCEKLGVSRQAVWKNISQLKEAGYQIESQPKKGYHLAGSADRLVGADIESRLEKDGLCQKVECLEKVDSTNTRAKQLAELGEPEGTLVVAEEQTAGKGRRGRGWASEPGIGIWMSLILRPELKPQQAASVTLVAAMAVASGIRECCHLETGIKWPNDVVVNGKKVCGILTETSSEPDYIHYVVPGIGINANTGEFPKELSDKATSIYLETGKKTNRNALIAEVMNAFSLYYGRYLQTGDLSLLQDEYNEMLVNRDREVLVLYGMAEEADPDKCQRGIAKGITPAGALIVETEEGMKQVVSGEVSVRGVYGYI
ncbi:MAG: biotin--[acetyl-CoA-carboxylase] ligase [Lachnospiraceae bacterium]|nr:biotin--[acetyl-CoA-carboxylase] ligase [Lachnospiraceae bacterium]